MAKVKTKLTQDQISDYALTEEGRNTPQFLEQQYGILPKDNSAFEKELSEFNYVGGYVPTPRLDPSKWKDLKETVGEVVHPTLPPETPKLIVTIELAEFNELVINIRAKLKSFFGKINKWWTDERKN